MYGKEIKYARMTTGATQLQVAKATGLPQSTISWIELDKGIPSIQMCVILADFYGITIDELIGRDGVVTEETVSPAPANSMQEKRLLKSFRVLEERRQEQIIDDVEYYASKIKIKA